MGRRGKALVVAVTVLFVAGFVFLVIGFTPDKQCDGFETPRDEMAAPEDC